MNMRLILRLACIASSALVVIAHAGPRSWSGAIEVSGVGDVAQGAGVAFSNFDSNARPDGIFVAYDAPAGPNQFRYRVAWNLDKAGKAVSFSAWKPVEGFGDEGQGAGVAISNLDADAKPEMIVMAYDNPVGANTFRYRVGKNINSSGNAASWGAAVIVPGVGEEADGASLAIGNIDANARPDMVLVAYDAPRDTGPNFHRYKIGFNLDSNGVAASWTSWRQMPGMGDAGQGIGVILGSFNGDTRPDMLVMAYDNPVGANNFRYRIAYDLDVQGRPTRWDTLGVVSGVGEEGDGAGAAMLSLDDDARSDLVFMAYDNPVGTNSFRYKIGWNFDRRPPRIDLRHSPMHPGKGKAVTYSVDARDSDRVSKIEILVRTGDSSTVIKTCNDTTTCSVTHGPYTTGSAVTSNTVSYSANVYDASGGVVKFPLRKFAYGDYPDKVRPLLVSGSTAKKIDIVFIRDSLTITTQSAFVADTAATIFDGYLQDELIDNNVSKFNFWYYTGSGKVNGLCDFTLPPNLATDAAFADVKGLLHDGTTRDCATGGVFSTIYDAGRVAVHETAHAAFGIEDEYCCDSSYSHNEPWPNIYPSKAICEVDANQSGWPAADCHRLSNNAASDWWTVNPSNIMGGCAGGFPNCASPGFDFVRSNRRRAVYVLDGLN